MTGNDFRLYAGVDFSREFLCHYGVGHDKGGHSGRYPWGSGKKARDKGTENGSITSAPKRKSIPEQYKNAVKTGAKLAAAALAVYGLNKVNETGNLIGAGQAIFDDFQNTFETGADMFNRVFKSNKKPKVIQDSISIIKDATKDRKYDLKDRTAYARECIDFYDNISKALGEQKNGFNPINKNLAEALSSDFTNILRSRYGFATSKDISNLMIIYNQTLSRLERPENSKYSSDFSKELLKTAMDDLKDILQFF